MARYELTDRQWERLAPLVPPEKPRVGRPNNDHRTILMARCGFCAAGRHGTTCGGGGGKAAEVVLKQAEWEPRTK